jgi:hypothetical protein
MCPLLLQALVINILICKINCWYVRILIRRDDFFVVDVDFIFWFW